ncbi:DHH family phosphoesterase [Patescibacteria group bacterium]|nr:DHH family phosphoesterase [Patescibacteria group bacterium]
MNNQQNNTLSRIAEVVNKGKSGVIIIPPNPSLDSIASSTAIYLSLTKIGKNVALACSQKPTSDLIAADKFQSVIGAGGDSLMISFPYAEGAIDKVDYNIQGESFNLIVTPRQGFSKLNPNQVSFSYTGGVVDFIIILDSPTLNSLGTIYSENQSQFTGKDIINIDRHLTNAYYGTINFVNKTASSISELALDALQSLRVELDRDIATNLYAGVAAATNNFTSYSTNADTFQNIATLLRMGAVKKPFRKPANAPPAPIPTFRAGNGPESQPTTPINKVEKEKQPSQQQFEEKNPQDALKPRIFKGGGLI